MENFVSLLLFSYETFKIIQTKTEDFRTEAEKMDALQMILELLGGLAIFLFGMHVMGEGLERRAGARMKEWLARLTSSRFRGLFLGIVVTALLQSSSAVMVMTVGFVNSGMMSLHQSIGVIMGTNVGTTVTSWLLSLTGVKGKPGLLRVLSPSFFAPILGVIGVWGYVFSKKERQRALGAILLGFTVLIFGMERMSAAVQPLAELPEFGEILLIFQNPFFGVLAGAILTAIIQSSSASIGILQALSITGRVSLATAIPIVMGQNIGTCATSLLSSIGTSVNAKRAATVHLYFNLFGTLILLTTFYLFAMLFEFPFMQSAATPVSIATIHTLFNVLSTLILYPLSSKLERLVTVTVWQGKEKKNEEKPYI